MKKNIIGSLVVAGMAAVTVGIFSNSTDVSAAGVATTFDHITRMYNRDGDLVTNRALGPNTPWQVGIFATINGETMYQVSTNEFVKASETTYEGPGGSEVSNFTKDDLYGSWINDNSKYTFYESGSLSIRGNGEKADDGIFSIVSVKGDQVTIIFNSERDHSGWTQTFTYSGNSLTSNSTGLTLYKVEYH
ncbi:SLAP domain-containing protein [Companilactobacillus baiquanensis]|uniref:SLAP domain-containing protein n=1 Tax=Companilactobacillus baiquanensis TaxID=2486005 RepID=A0ABW1UWN9_9LACO|nr:SLAP domain-containing protein [Companilactobacillus baiquanensis]